MVKKSKPKRRGIPKGVQRHKLRANKVNDTNTFFASTLNLVGWNIQQVSYAAETCWNYSVSVCTLLSLIPLVSRDGNKFDYAPIWKRIIHYVLVIFYASFMMYKLAVTVYYITYEDLNLSTFMCGCSFLVLFASLCTASGSSLTTAEMRELLNSWEPVLRSIEETNGKRVEVFGDILVCIKVILLTGLAQCAAMNAAALSLVFADLPVCVFPIMKRLGMIPDNLLPAIAWQMLFYPLELLTLLAPMYATVFNVHTFILGLGIFGFYAETVRYLKKYRTCLYRSLTALVLIAGTWNSRTWRCGCRRNMPTDP